MAEKASSVSIPQGTIKRDGGSRYTYVIRGVSIPQGTIKSPVTARESE